MGDKMEPNPESSHCACIPIVFIFLNGERILDDQEVIADRNEVMGEGKRGKGRLFLVSTNSTTTKGAYIIIHAGRLYSSALSGMFFFFFVLNNKGPKKVLAVRG